MPFRRALLPVLFGACLPGLVCVVCASCRGATEITVDVRTNVACQDPTQWQGIALYSGAPGLDVETKDPTLTTKACDASGYIGSIVVVPSSSNDATIAVRVVAGLTRPPDQCAAAGYDGCIVARRTLAFIPHEGAKLEIDLTSDCVSHACDLLHTCVNGQCADARQSSLPTGDAAAAVTGPRVRCGTDPSLTCPANDPSNACCVGFANDAITSAACKPTSDCVAPATTLLCDNSSDCAGNLDDAGAPWVCCVYADLGNAGSTGRYLNSQCLPRDRCDPSAGYKTYLCNDQTPCFPGPDELQCVPLTKNQLPSYFGCDTNNLK